MSATQARVAVLGVLGLLLLACAAVPVTAAKGELLPARTITREAADPAAGLGGRLERARQRDEAAVARFLVADASAKLEQRWADEARAAERERQAEVRRQQERADRSSRSSSTSGGVWAALRACENGGSYTSAPGDRYRGAYQFDRGTWAGLGYSGDPASAAPAVQDQAARELQARSGWGQWPSCARRLGLL